MPRDEELLGTRSGRKESPEVELIMQEQIGDALASLISSKGLYQKSDISFEEMGLYLKSIELSGSLETLKQEFSKRPWVPVTPDLTQDKYMRAQLFCGIGDGPIGISNDELKLSFPLPSVKMYCCKCKDENTFHSVGVLWADGFIDYYPRLSDQTEQLFNLHYKCGICKNNIIGFLIKRFGSRLALCGRTERLHIKVSNVIPKKLRNIVADAIGAANENDIFAGFYHLRTFCEHYMKNCLELPIGKKINGDELSSKYNSSLDSRITSGLPSIASIYEKTSKLMHDRSGTHQDFISLLDKVEGHLTAKNLFSKYTIK